MEDLIKSLKEALEFSPDNIPLKLQLAHLLLDESETSEAEQYFKEVLALDSSNGKAKAGLAKTYFMEAKYGVASVILEEIIQLQPENKSLLVLYSKCLFKEGDLKRAQQIYAKIIALDPDYRDHEMDGVMRQAQMAGEQSDEFIDEDAIQLLQDPEVTFSDVGGMAEVKNEIGLKIIQPLQHPELYEAYGKKIGGGILLYGPPGCGKTYLAKATAGEINAKFISIGINDVLDMWIGNSEKNLHEIFETARRNKPCVLFFDEVDALGASRSDMRQSTGRHLINQFLSEMDGVDSDNEGVLILGATNAPWHLDPAFRRPGRFDRIVFVKPPDLEGRAAILKILLEEKPTGTIDLEQVAKKTPEFSGADLSAVVDVCVENKLSQSFQSGVPSPIETKDLLKAVKSVRPSTREWFSSAKNYALYANESGLYDEILDYLKIKK